MAGHRAGRGEARRLQPRVLDQVERQHDVHRAFDRRAADLAVALRGVGVADREQRAGDLDRQVERRAGGQIADVEIAADAARRHHRMQAGLGRREADGAGEGLQRHPAVLAEQRRLQRVRIVFPDVQRRLLELVGEQAEARNVGRPAEARGLEALDRDLERVARLGAVDEDRAGDRVDLAEVERCDVGDGARRAKLARRSNRGTRTRSSSPAPPARPGRSELSQPK